MPIAGPVGAVEPARHIDLENTVNFLKFIEFSGHGWQVASEEKVFRLSRYSHLNTIIEKRLARTFIKG